MKPRIAVAAGIIIVIFAAVILLERGQDFYYAGTVEATEVDVSARVSTVIDRVNVREGDKVKKNDILATLTGEDIRAVYDNAERDFRRASELIKVGSINQGDYDRQKYRYDDARIRIGWLTVASPTNGTVLTRYHEPGEMVSPGTKLLALADLDIVWAYVYVPQPMLSVIKTGMEVKAYVPESNMREITGKIVKINDEAEFTPKNVQTRKERTRLVYGVKLEFSNTDNFLKPGMTVEAKLPEK
jgi:HlyD family secretion protein